jgi:CDP-glycerol glycerophosphotransferase
MGIEDSEFLRNVSAYPSLNDLMMASDMLISDYSSIFFDYAIQGKPMLCYCYDYETYAEKRGMYFDIREWLPSASNEEELIRLIGNTDTTTRNEATIKFQQEYVTEYGHATEKSLDIIYEQLLK